MIIRMKKILLSLFAVLFLGLVLNCSSMPAQNPYLQRQWMLVSFEGFTKEQLIANKAEINLTSKMELNYAIVKYLEGQLYINKLYLYV